MVGLPSDSAGRKIEVVPANDESLETARPDDLEQAISRWHHCTAIWIETVVVPAPDESERAPGQQRVGVFALAGHPDTDRCYGWWAPAPDSPSLSLRAVLHGGPVKSAVDALAVVRLVDRGKPWMPPWPRHSAV